MEGESEGDADAAPLAMLAALGAGASADGALAGWPVAELLDSPGVIGRGATDVGGSDMAVLPPGFGAAQDHEAAANVTASVHEALRAQPSAPGRCEDPPNR